MIAQLFFEAVASHPQKTALWIGEDRFTYQRLAAFALTVRQELVRQGVKPGHRIGVDMPNNATSVAFMLACAMEGVAIVPLNPGATNETQRKACAATRVHHRFSNSSLPVLGVEHAPLGDLNTSYLPFLITTTSGSTGTPKPVVITQAVKMRRIQALIDFYQITEEDTILAGTPLHHSLAQRLVLMPLMVGGTAILMPRYTPQDWLSCLQNATFTIAVPTQIQTLHPFNYLDLIHVRHLVSSSAPMRAVVRQDLTDWMGSMLSECYGTTEIAVATIRTSKTGDSQSVGVPLPGVEIKIIDEQGRLLPDGMMGEIAVNSPYRFSEYFNQPELTQESFWHGDYFKTGDLGYISAQRLYVSGRLHDIIKTGGINVHLHDVETTASINPTLREVAAFAVPDPDLGEVVGLAVVPRGTADLRMVKQWCASYLEDAQIPRHYLVMDHIPHSETGKVDRKSLLNTYNERSE